MSATTPQFDEAKVRQVVFDFVQKTVKAKTAEGKNFYGDYFNSACYGSHFPTRMVSILSGGENKLSVMYTCGSWMWTFAFTMDEINQPIVSA